MQEQLTNWLCITLRVQGWGGGGGGGGLYNSVQCVKDHPNSYQTSEKLFTYLMAKPARG